MDKDAALKIFFENFAEMASAKEAEAKTDPSKYVEYLFYRHMIRLLITAGIMQEEEEALEKKKKRDEN